jgi:hypothetical protein
MSDISAPPGHQAALEAWQQSQGAGDLASLPATAGKQPASAQAHLSVDYGAQPWQPNLLDMEGEPAPARATIRAGSAGKIDIDTTGHRQGWGVSTGAQGNLLGGIRFPNGMPTVDGGFNPSEVFAYENYGLGRDAVDDLKKKLPVPGVDKIVDADKGLVHTYSRKGSESYERQEFRHAAGFYPGDKSAEGRRLQQQNDFPLGTTPDFEERRWSGKVSSHSGGYVQFYGSVNVAAETGLTAARYIASRNDTSRYAHKSIGVEGNTETIGVVGNGYAFEQDQARIKAKSNGEFAADIGTYAEAGGNATSVFHPGTPVASDWWLADGVLKSNLEDPRQTSRGNEFEDLAAFGFQLKGESLIPALGDRTAEVFLRVPDANVNFGNRTPGQSQDVLAIPPDAAEGEYVLDDDGVTRQRPEGDTNEYRTQTDRKVDENFLDWAKRKVPFTRKDEYISVENLSALMTQAAGRAPRHIELAYVTPDALIDANAQKLYTIVDPTTGEKTRGFKVGDWVNTGLMQVEGQGGLFVDRDRLPESAFNADGSIDQRVELDHWKGHLSPQGEESLATPKRLADINTNAEVVDEALPPSLHNTEAGYLNDARELAARINAAAGREVVGLARPDDAVLDPGKAFTTVPKAGYYANPRQYVDDLQNYITAIRDIYSVADTSRIEIPQRRPDEPVSARRHLDDAQERLDWLVAHRETVISNIERVQKLRRETEGENKIGRVSAPQPHKSDAFPIK